MYKEPDFLVEYKRLKALPPPKCCHTCDFYNKKTMFCSKYNMNPPEDFVNTQDNCPNYIEELPF